MNFISTFEELNKLYEEAIPEVDKKPVEETVAEENSVEEACAKEALNEAADDEEIEIVDDEVPAEEAPVEEPVVEDEPRQLILECDKCGALVIKSEADVVTDEESGLVNVEDECQFCEETKGYKIVGVMVPYEVATEEDIHVDESLDKEAELSELLDISPNISLNLDGGENNDVDVLS